MIHTKNDFFNEAKKEIREKYFPNEKHGHTQNTNYHATTYTMELFNNGCLTYRKPILRLSKACNVNSKQAHDIISKYIISFGSYKPKFKN